MKQRVLLKDSAQDRKQRMFIYVLAFVVMTATLGMFAWGHDGRDDETTDAGYYIECEYTGVEDVLPEYDAVEDYPYDYE